MGSRERSGGASVLEASNREAGFTLVELTITVLIFIVGILATGIMQASGIRESYFARRLTLQTLLAQDKLEELNALPYNAPSLDLIGEDEAPHGGESPAGHSGYTVSWTVTAGLVSNTKQITVTVEKNSKTTEIISIRSAP